MSFVDEFSRLPLGSLLERSQHAPAGCIKSVLAKRHFTLSDFAALISAAGSGLLEPLCSRSQTLTRQRFGKVIRLFAPLYLSNECINNCSYCGFSRDNQILRVTLSVDEVLREGRALKAQGFRNVLLVAGEHPRFVSSGYLLECVRALHNELPSISLEVGPMETADYASMVQAGADGLKVAGHGAVCVMVILKGSLESVVEPTTFVIRIKPSVVLPLPFMVVVAWGS